MIDVDLRTTFLALAALGLFAGLAAPVASADKQVPPPYAGSCLPTQFGEAKIGPVTVDARTLCPTVTVHEDEDCDLEDPSPTEELPRAEACAGGAGDRVDVGAEPPPLVCVDPLGC